jgi:multiple sugar transport system ATP-binding protein
VTSGDLQIGEKRVNDVDPAQRDIAIVFQNYALYPHMTVLENLSFGLKLRGVDTDEISQRVGRTATMLGIEPLFARKPSQLSGGQRQRVALGRALVREPQAFLLDEPLSNLDAKLRAAMRTELIKLHRNLGTTIVHVTHDQVEAMTRGERICIMKDGEIVQVGPPMEVYRNPVNTFVAGFLASPPMNLLTGHLEAGDDGAVVARSGNVSLSIPATVAKGFRSHIGKPVTLGLRPEDFHLSPTATSHTASLNVEAVTTEVLGPEVILVASAGGDGAPEIQARMPRDFRASPGEGVILHFDLNEIQVFDAATTRALPVRRSLV